MKRENVDCRKERIECRRCDAPYCDGCNINTLSKMLNSGKFDCIMDEHRSINPAAEVAEVRHGEWKLLSEKQFCDGSYETTFYCSLCHREVAVCHEAWHGAEKVLIGKYPCCHCGARMDGKGGTV